LWQHVLFWGGLAATVLVVILVTRTARQALNQSLNEHKEHPVSSPTLGVHS
jgi:hypothetical protein